LAYCFVMGPKAHADGKKIDKKSDKGEKCEKGEKSEEQKTEAKEHAVNISKMLSLLKYRACADKNKKGTDLKDAQAALEQYTNLEPSQKRKFVEDFVANGSGKKPGSLKFHLNYKQTLTETKETEMATTEDYYTLPQILGFHSLRWADYPEKKAKEIAMQLVTDNAEAFGHNMEPQIHPSMDLLSKFFYVHGGGCTKRRKQEKKDEWMKKSDDQKGVAKSLEDDKQIMAASSSDGIKKEAPNWDSLQVKIGLAKAAMSSIQKLHNQMTQLHFKYKVAGKKDEALRIKGEELHTKMETLNTYMNIAHMQLAEAEEMTKEDDNIETSLTLMNGLVSTADHHLGGAKEAFKRYSNILGK